MPLQNNYDVMIIGAGAAGMMAAIECGKRGRSVCLIDHAKKPGEKIRISGGGRCNFTNLNCGPQAFLSQNPHFCKSALRQYSQHDFIAMVESYNIAYHEKTLGQLFCDRSAKDIINMLLDECRKYNVEIFLETSVKKIEGAKSFNIKTTKGDIECDSLIMATGALSIPKMGATGFAYDVARQYGHSIVDTFAGLVPLTFEGARLDNCKTLAGVALPCQARFENTEFAEAMLFTHRGISGPAVLQISSYWDGSSPIEINLLPDKHAFEFLKSEKLANPKTNIENILKKIFPNRLADLLCTEQNLFGNIAECSDQSLQELASRINQWTFPPDGTEGYRTAEVTVGGINTDELSSKTMESRKQPGLFFIGECVDVTGWLGGYNFQWAWSSGFVAGQNA